MSGGVIILLHCYSIKVLVAKVNDKLDVGKTEECECAHDWHVLYDCG